MNSEKLSRSLRFYYNNGILKKVSGHRHIYQFLELPFEYQPLIRLSPYERQKQLLNARKTVLQSKEGDAKSEKSYMLEGDQEETASHRRAETRGSAGTSERQRLLDAQREVSIIPESLLKNATGSNDLKKQSLSQDLTSNERRQSLEGVLCHKISVPRPVINCTKSKNISAEQATRQRSTAFDQPIVNGTSKLVRSTENIQNRYRSGVKSPSVANMHPQNQHLTASYQRRDDHIRVRNYRRSQSADEATETMMPCAFPSPKVYIAREAKTTQCSPFLMDPHRTMSVPTTSLLPWFLDPSCINCIAAKGIKGSRIIFPAGYKKAK
ncbi:predicted protein [Nematostella vectensis]|uniref:ETS domain-containing protein n=1 Tax=Nematostella vectensis TaxID=45351 RepID=A7RSZ9_NEMVE|nr:predicted protein [Nematostella vectensis]|eukprot:XP_001637425.1 predicted protein [Nematostella vectensis]